MTPHPVGTDRLCAACGVARSCALARFCPHQSAPPDEGEYQIAKDGQQSAATRSFSCSYKLFSKTGTPPSFRERGTRDVQKGVQRNHQTSHTFLKKHSDKSLLMKVGCTVGLLLILAALLTSVLAQNTDPLAQRQANQSKARLETLLQHARALGVPAVFLQSARTQEQQLTHSSPPFFFASRQSATGYYRSLAQRYQIVSSQVQATLVSVTQQFQGQAQQDMQTFQTTLSASKTTNSGMTQYFAQQLSQAQFSLSVAQTPGEYAAVSTKVRQTLQVLKLMASISTQLRDFHTALTRMSDAHVDVVALQAYYEHDVQLFANATQAEDFNTLETRIGLQYQHALERSLQAFPALSSAQLQKLEAHIHLLHIYGVGTTKYQQLLDIDQHAAAHAKTVSDQLGFFTRVDGDIASLQSDLVQGNAHYLVKQFHQEVERWAKAHPYKDAYDGHIYALDNGYMKAGIGGELDNDLTASDTQAGFETVIAEVNNALFNLHLFEADVTDHTAYNQIHATDRSLLSHYTLSKKQVLVISLAEQAMRIYQNGSLVNSYHVTTGRQELPSLPGVWTVLGRRSPVIFTAAEPKGSPFWFPDTPISYAILYHLGGYFVHDAPWRANFGPGTQFPHQDVSGTTAYNFDGSHGCINLQASDASWVYNHTGWETAIVIY